MARKIPEILGYHEDWPNGCDPWKVWWKNGRPQPLTWQPSDDEMLAWLKETGRFIALAHVQGMEHIVIEVRHKPKGGLWWDQPVRGETLRGTLEAALQACDEFDNAQVSRDVVEA